MCVCSIKGLRVHRQKRSSIETKETKYEAKETKYEAKETRYEAKRPVCTIVPTVCKRVERKVKNIHQEAKKERPVPVAFLRDPSLLCDIMWSTQPLYTCTIRYANVSKQKFLS
jgi:hypothetical protein